MALSAGCHATLTGLSASAFGSTSAAVLVRRPAAKANPAANAATVPGIDLATSRVLVFWSRLASTCSSRWRSSAPSCGSAPPTAPDRAAYSDPIRRPLICAGTILTYRSSSRAGQVGAGQRDHGSREGPVGAAAGRIPGRGAPDMAALTDVLHRLARLAADLALIAELDINPLILALSPAAHDEQVRSLAGSPHRRPAPGRTWLPATPQAHARGRAKGPHGRAEGHGHSDARRD